MSKTKHKVCLKVAYDVMEKPFENIHNTLADDTMRQIEKGVRFGAHRKDDALMCLKYRDQNE